MIIKKRLFLFSLSLILILILSCTQSKNDYPANWTEPITQMEFVLIKPGKFKMGTPPGEEGQHRLDHYHEVELTRAFYIGKYEVTQGQWKKIMSNSPSYFAILGDSLPVENINWYEVKEFIERLNSVNPDYKFSLPTEAQWEYSCRAGTTTPYNTGENLTTEDANYDGDFPYKRFPKGIYRRQPLPVGSFKPNAWGLYDMHGNVWEWCEDWFCEYPKYTVKDPIGKCDTTLKVIRGGSWYFNAESARSGRRYTHHPEDNGFSLGFRLICEI